ncbi:MAG: hypothetical protein KJ063_06895 [Anaerolineae bacterium]|nr:hypothetical protein [Anaerolineae bacterium]
MNDDQPIPTRPVSDSTRVLRQKFYEQFAAQSDQMDKLAGQLLTVQLAIPGLYAAVLKLTQGPNATITTNGWFYLTFGCWLIALLLTMICLIPRSWSADPTVIEGDPAGRSQTMGVVDFFRQTAQYKRRLIIAAASLFWAGIFCSFFI